MLSKNSTKGPDSRSFTEKLDALALEFWASKGARYGERMKVGELTYPFKEDPENVGHCEYAWLPSSFTKETEFICVTACVESYIDSKMQNFLIVTLYGRQIKKNGEPYKNLTRITWLYPDEQWFGDC